MVVGSRGHKEMAKKEFHINNKVKELVAWYEMHGVSKLIILKEKIGFWKKKRELILDSLVKRRISCLISTFKIISSVFTLEYKKHFRNLK